jgi:site-specific DNA-methyltransferase (adenine-specific)
MMMDTDSKHFEIIHGDCTEISDDVIPQYDFLFTDPPYGISRKNNFVGMKGNRGGTYGMDFGQWDKEPDLITWIPKALDKLKKGGNIVIFHDWKKLSYIVEALENNGCVVKRCLIWTKTNPTPFNRDRLFVNTNEFMVWAVKKGGRWTFNRKKSNFESGVFSYPSNSKNYHPTQKPVPLLKEIIEILSNESDLIYDPFAGSGSIGLASMETNRRYLGVEREEEYITLINNRKTIRDHTRLS